MNKSQKIDPEKVLLVDKPLNWTSFDVVKKVRGKFKLKKVGHAGTLDPLATGLLILCTGKKTKQINEFMELEKEYSGSFTIGATTPSFDLETEPENFIDISQITEEDCYKVVELFKGDIEQTPPMYSAIKVEGVRAYELARKGEEVKLKIRTVHISNFDIKCDFPEIHFNVVCSKGTYIRSLARDFGHALKVGAYLSSLRRERIGHYNVNDAVSVEKLMEYESL